MTILFDIFPATGHYNASFAIAAGLKSAGHRVVYCGDGGFEQIITEKGLKFVPSCSRFILPDKYQFLNKGFALIAECFKSMLTQSRQKQIIKNAYDFKDVVKGIAPDFVVLDAHLSIKSIVYRQLEIPLILLETMPLSFPDPYVPPFTSAFIPTGSQLSFFWINCLWRKLVLKRKFFNIFNAMLFFGQDFQSLHRKLANLLNFSLQGRIDIKRPFVTGIKGMKTLATVPSCFDFPRKYLPDCYFTESGIDVSRDEIIVNKRYLKLIEIFRQFKQKQSNTRLIYCSLGTVSSDSGNRHEIFFKKIKKLCLRHPAYIFVLSTGACSIANLLPLPSNMYIFRHLPQMDILKHCDLMITHGGMNSIAECIWNEIPMLVLPLSYKWDQPGNSARVVYHGLGLRGSIRNDTVCQFEKKIHCILRDYSFYKQRLSLMKLKMYPQNDVVPAWWKLFDLLKEKVA